MCLSTGIDREISGVLDYYTRWRGAVSIGKMPKIQNISLNLLISLEIALIFLISRVSFHFSAFSAEMQKTQELRGNTGVFHSILPDTSLQAAACAQATECGASRRSPPVLPYHVQNFSHQ